MSAVGKVNNKINRFDIYAGVKFVIPHQTFIGTSTKLAFF